MRGTPLMLQVMVVYYGPSLLLGMTLPRNWRFAAVIVAFVINYAAYFAEIYRGGIESISAGQYEAAQVLGYRRGQTFFRIILPQMVKRVLPSVTNEVITLVKDTSRLRHRHGRDVHACQADRRCAKFAGYAGICRRCGFLFRIQQPCRRRHGADRKGVRLLPLKEGPDMNTLNCATSAKSFDGQGVLEDISLSVPAGSVTAIIGPSGSGKSTLLRCATLLETADGGDIIYEGKYAAKDGVYAPKAELHAIRRYFGLVFQSYNLFPHFTLLKNVMDAPAQVEAPRRRGTRGGHGAARENGSCRSRRRLPLPALSGGQQRAAIARALCMKPELLFLTSRRARLTRS